MSIIDKENVIKGKEKVILWLEIQLDYLQKYANSDEILTLTQEQAKEIVTHLKEQEIEEPHPWEHIWDAPDYTFKGRCRNCGFIHYFIQGHDTQYRFCPQCGKQKVI